MEFHNCSFAHFLHFAQLSLNTLRFTTNAANKILPKFIETHQIEHKINVFASF